jgi:hypothetical protein
VTEKVANAMLAGAVPIYFGHHGSLSDVGIDPLSVIDCSDVLTSGPDQQPIDAELDRCVQRVVDVDTNETLYVSGICCISYSVSSIVYV